ncbi:MAG: hypothetical protein M3Y59_24420 [Myxococcota bacterium]|nr:hypothetical protein [Myxococcota bacterium]
MLWLVWLTAVAAPAAELPRLAILPYATAPGTPPELGARFQSLLGDELLTRDAQLTWVEPPRAGPPSQRAEAMRQLAQGRRQLAAGEFQAASVSLRKGISLGLIDPVTAPMDDVVEGLVSLAIAELRTGDERQARSALAQVVRLAPLLRLSKNKYPPVVIREFDRTRARVLKGGMGSLTLQGPPGSIAYVDGRKAGPVPAVVRGLPVGAHFLRLETPEGQKAGMIFELSATRAEVTLTPSQPVEVPKFERSLTAEDLPRLVAHAAAVGADLILLGALEGQGVQVRAGSALYSVAAHALLPLPEVLFAPAGAGGAVAALNLMDAVVSRLGAPRSPLALPLDLLGGPPIPARVESAVVVPPPAVKPAPPQVSATGPGLLGQVPWWVWAGGAVVVGGVATAGFLHASRPVTGTVDVRW